MATAQNSSVSNVVALRPCAFRADAAIGLRAAGAAVIVLVLLRIVLASTTNLAEDEAYYWLWSRHLAAGYYDHPPMIAYWIRAGTGIFGQTEFGVRFVGLASAIAASYLLYLASLSLFRDQAAAALCVIWMNSTILCSAAAIVTTPDTPLALFATLTLFALAKLIETGRGAWWLLIGAALGLAFMSKYTAALLLPGVFLWMIATADGRRWFARPEPYLGAAIALLCVAPVFYWNYAHDWASFAKQAQHSIKDTPANALASMAELFGAQAGLATPLIFLFCLFGSFYAFARGLKRAEQPLLLLGAMSAPLFAFFFLHAANQKIQPNWPGFVYPAAILAAVHGVLAYSRELKRDGGWLRQSFRAAPWMGAAFTLVTFLQLGLGPLPLKARQDPTTRLKGWAKLGEEVERLRQERGAALVLTERYAITGELAFYGANADRVAQIDERIRYANLPPPNEAEIKGAPALLVTRLRANQARAVSSFDSSVRIATILRGAGHGADDFYEVYLLSGYRGGLFSQ
jgi:4-amino-4-deoxy-L-arabinose transferase-like glycosyltransferase